MVIFNPTDLNKPPEILRVLFLNDIVFLYRFVSIYNSFKTKHLLYLKDIFLF
jgi:hypothetical protein